MKRAGMAARKILAERELEAQFAEADARAQDEQAEVLARMDTAVAAAAAAYGDTLSDGRRRRLALVLKQLYFCGATKREGSNMRVQTLRQKLGSEAPSVRQLTYDLELLYLWELVVSERRLRGVGRRLNLPLIDELVAARRGVAYVEKSSSYLSAKTSYLSAASFPSHLKNCVGRSPKLPAENKSASFKSAAISERPAAKTSRHPPPLPAPRPPPPVSDGLAWSELAELLGADEETLEEVLRERLTPCRLSLILDLRRSGVAIPDYLTLTLLEAVA